MTTLRPYFGSRFALACVLACGFATVAKALAPLLLVPPAIEVATGVLTMKNFLAASAGAHLAVALLWGNKDGSSNPPSSPSGSQITVYIDPKKPLVTPSGWTPANPGTSNTGSNPQPLPPSTMPLKATWVIDGSSTTYDTHVKALDGVCAPKAGTSPLGYPETTKFTGKGSRSSAAMDQSEPTSGSTSVYCEFSGSYSGFSGSGKSITKQASCPDGYVSSGSECTLNNAASVKKPADQSCSIMRAGNTFTVDPQDPDCDTMAATMPTPTTVKLKKANEVMEATINPDGTVTTKMSGPDGTGNTQTTTVKFGGPNTDMGVPATGQSEATTAGQGELNDPNAPIAPGPKLELPTDYNREPTQQAIKTDIGKIKDELTKTGEDLSAAKAGYDAQKTSIENSLKGDAGGWFESLKAKWYSFQPPIESAGCTPLTQSFKSISFTWDFCPAVNVIRALLGLLAYFGTLAALWQIGLGTRHA